MSAETEVTVKLYLSFKSGVVVISAITEQRPQVYF